MKKLILTILFTILFISSCGTVKKYEQMSYSIDTTLFRPFIDSLFIKEKLPPLNDTLWLEGLSFIDHETNEPVYQATYIKNDSTSYIVTIYGDAYNFKKRIVETITKNRKH